VTRSAPEAVRPYTQASRRAAPEPKLARELEQVLVPRVLAAAPLVVIGRDDHATFLRAVLGAEEDGAMHVVRGLRERGIAVQAIYLDLLAPTANALGELWSADECDFVEVTVALGRLQGVLRELSRVFIAGVDPTAPLAGRVLLSCIPGEQHTLGLFMIAEFLIRDGWGVSVGPPILESDLLQLLRSEWFDVIGFSVTCDSRLPRLQREIRRVRAASCNADLGVLVGGRVFNQHPGLVARRRPAAHARPQE
jgi:methanogenic corrinoid protein MtbC1